MPELNDNTRIVKILPPIIRNNQISIGGGTFNTSFRKNSEENIRKNTARAKIATAHLQQRKQSSSKFALRDIDKQLSKDPDINKELIPQYDYTTGPFAMIDGKLVKDSSGKLIQNPYDTGDFLANQAHAAANAIDIGIQFTPAAPIYNGLRAAKLGSNKDLVGMVTYLIGTYSPIARNLSSSIASELNKAQDLGTFWDKYTTFRGRFGNFSTNPVVNAYATYARRYNLPDKARIPSDAIRKIKTPEGEILNVNNKLVDITGGSRLGNNHTNFSLDRGVTSHSKGGWDMADTYVVPTKTIISKGGLKSIEPSDMFFDNSKRMLIPAKNITVISGDPKTLLQAQKEGFQTLSSPKLRRLYAERNAQYLKELQEYNSYSGVKKKITKPPVSTKYVGYFQPYSSEINRLLKQRGTPTLKDFRFLENKTGLSAGVTSINELQNALKQLNIMENSPITTKMIPYKYPNGRSVEWGEISKERDLINKAEYNKVFYDPATFAEHLWKYGKSYTN